MIEAAALGAARYIRDAPAIIGNDALRTRLLLPGTRLPIQKVGRARGRGARKGSRSRPS